MTDRGPAIHIAGAGLAGLSAALQLTKAGHIVRLYEASGHAGGRCRSYFDETLGCRIDNGNHLLVSGNASAMAYLSLIGTKDSLVGPASAQFPFIDLRSGHRWVVEPSSGPIPWWIFDHNRRVPGTKASDYLSGLRLARAAPDETIAKLLSDKENLYKNFWEPLAVAVLNTEADQAAARLLWPVLKETFGRGGAYCRPLIVREGLSESFVDPALRWLEARGVPIRFGTRLRSLTIDAGAVSALDFGEGKADLGPEDAVILAVPPSVAASLVPDLTVPGEFRGIVNAHFVLPEEATEVTILGMIGGTAEWLFRHGRLASITISAATRFMDQDADDLAGLIWRDVARALNLPIDPMPPWRIVKEKRATFAQTPEQLKRRPPAKTAIRNLVLAGDWTDTGLPATIEGAIRSGESAAKCFIGVTARNAMQH